MWVKVWRRESLPKHVKILLLWVSQSIFLFFSVFQSFTLMLTISLEKDYEEVAADSVDAGEEEGAEY